VKALALDIGEKRIGVAVGDTSDAIALPVCVLPTTEVLSNARTWRHVLEDHEPDVLVCGLPKTMAGEEGPQARRVREAGERISLSCGITLDFVDERLSSAEAKRILRLDGLSEKRMRGKVDMIAASLFLQTWLDARKR
jgi:putative Holliday junction resolvase